MRRLPAGAPILSAAAMRAAEERAFTAGRSQDDLMERAGATVAEVALRIAAGRPVLVLAGPGNNGGDAYVVARLLAGWGHDVMVAALGRPKHGAAARMAARWAGATCEFADAAPRPILVDGLLGTGRARAFDQAGVAVLDRLRSFAELVIAIDLPSGVDADGGEANAAMPADITVALGALKPAHLIGPNAEASGHVLLGSLGIETPTRWRTIGRPARLEPAAGSHKFSRGMVVVVGGAMPGASWLTASAALHGGAGYVVLAEQVASSGVPHALVRRTAATARELATLLDDPRIGAVVIGPGLGRDRTARERLDVVLACAHDVIVDGDALSLLGRSVALRIRADRRSVILTPHAGEFARMFATTGNKIAQTTAAARESGTTIVHKGPDTVIADRDGNVVVAAGASPWLSTAGTGDVLAGLVAARQVARRRDAAEAAVWLHGRAAALAGAGFAADDLIAALPTSVSQCR